MNAGKMGLVVITLERYFKIVHAIAHRNYYRDWMTSVGLLGRQRLRRRTKYGQETDRHRRNGVPVKRPWSGSTASLRQGERWRLVNRGC